MLAKLVGALGRGSVTATQWGFRGIELGATGVNKVLGLGQSGITAAGKGGEWLLGHPGVIRGGITAAAAGVGYATAGGGYEGLERAAAFGLGAHFVSKPGMASAIAQSGRAGHVLAKETGSVRAAMGTLAKVSPVIGPIARNPFKSSVIAGAAYGALDTDTNILTGAATGAAVYGLTRSMGGRSPMTTPGRTGMAIGGGLGFVMGEGPGDALKGMAIGGGIGLGAKAVIKHPVMVGAPALGGAVIAGASMEAANAIRSQRANYDLDADGSVALGLHSLRHG